jgi:hypothetical protein
MAFQRVRVLSTKVAHLADDTSKHARGIAPTLARSLDESMPGPVGAAPALERTPTGGVHVLTKKLMASQVARDNLRWLEEYFLNYKASRKFLRYLYFC